MALALLREVVVWLGVVLQLDDVARRVGELAAHLPTQLRGRGMRGRLDPRDGANTETFHQRHELVGVGEDDTEVACALLVQRTDLARTQCQRELQAEEPHVEPTVTDPPHPAAEVVLIEAPGGAQVIDRQREVEDRRCDGRTISLDSRRSGAIPPGSTRHGTAAPINARAG